MQGDPLSMVFLCPRHPPLIQHLQTNHTNICQVWYADDSSGAGQLQALRQWGDDLKEVGKAYGYQTSSSKTFLLVKPDFEEAAINTFAGTGIGVVMDSAQYLGSAIGTMDFVSAYISEKVHEWQRELEQLEKV